MKDINVKNLWLLSLILSIIPIVLIGYKWMHVNRMHDYTTDVIRNEADLEEVLKEVNTIEFRDGKKPIHIPTGYHIESLAFVNPIDVNVTGYIWQKFPVDSTADLQKGIVFPEEVSSGNTVIEQVYSYEGVENGIKYQTIGWYFDVIVRQPFDYSRYPLNYLTVWLRLWSTDFLNHDRFLFIPDFKAYTDMEDRVYGLDQDMVSGEWMIDETFFSYQDIRYDTDFGLFTDVHERVYKEFFINIGIQRKFINAFIINLVPLFVVALLLFAQVMTVSADEHRMEMFGFNTSGAIATCSALFFVVMLAHVQVRRQFSGSGLVYIEYFYLIMYIVILLTALNAYVFSLGHQKNFNLIHYHDNIIPKAAFWPVVLWLMAIATLTQI